MEEAYEKSVPVSTAILQPRAQAMQHQLAQQIERQEKTLGQLEDAAAGLVELYCVEHKPDELEVNDVPGFSDTDAQIRDAVDQLARLEYRHKISLSLFSEPLTDPDKVYSTKITTFDAGYAKRTARDKYGHSKLYAGFRQRIWEVIYGDSRPFPPLWKIIPSEEGDGHESEDDEIEVGGQTTNFKCPLTLKLFEDPVCTPCGHYFSRAAIIEHLNNVATCPMPGCREVLRPMDISVDESFAKRLAAYRRRLQRSEHESLPVESAYVSFTGRA